MIQHREYWMSEILLSWRVETVNNNKKTSPNLSFDLVNSITELCEIAINTKKVIEIIFVRK